jgi:hypothetical protein
VSQPTINVFKSGSGVPQCCDTAVVVVTAISAALQAGPSSQHDASRPSLSFYGLYGGVQFTVARSLCARARAESCVQDSSAAQARVQKKARGLSAVAYKAGQETFEMRLSARWKWTNRYKQSPRTYSEIPIVIARATDTDSMVL